MNLNKQLTISMDKVVDRNISPRAILIYMILKNENTNSLSYDDLSNLLNTSAMTIRNCVKELEKANWIKIQKQGRSNFYTFN